MTASETNRGRPKSAALHRSILDAACEVLTRDGYRGFSFDAVAREAGTTRPALYRRWAHRNELLLASYDHILGVNEHAVLLDSDLQNLSDTALDALLEATVKELVEVNTDPVVCAVTMSVCAAMYEDEGLRELVHEHHYSRRQSLERLLHHAQQRGLLRTDVALSNLVQILIGCIQYHSHMLQEPISPAYLADVMRLLRTGG